MDTTHRAKAFGRYRMRVGLEWPAATGWGSRPSVSYVRNPVWPAARFGGRARLKSVSSTVLYHTPTFIIWRASSAVATLRPNCSQVFTAHSTCFTDSQRCLCMSQILSSLPTRTWAPRMIAKVWIATLPRMLLQNVTLLAQRGAAIAAQGHVHRPHVHARAHQALNDLELVDVGRYEVGLDAVGAQPLQVLEVEGWRRIHDHATPGGLHLG